MKFLSVIFLAVFLMSEPLKAQQFDSGETQVSVIELFTSEGCSSCPPADRWLSRLQNDPELWQGFVPLAFHVDYWDYIGWKDRFASKEFSQRQRRYAKEYNEATVYTPGVRRNGDEWRGWPFAKSIKANAEKVGALKISVANDRRFMASYSHIETNTQASVLNVAVLGLNLETEVQRGENRGKTLKHDFVVLGLSQYATAQSGYWQGEIPVPSSTAPSYAIAAWVSDGRNVKPIQAVGGFLDASVFAR